MANAFYTNEQINTINKAIERTIESMGKFNGKDVHSRLNGVVPYVEHRFTRNAAEGIPFSSHLIVYPGHLWVFTYGFEESRHKDVLSGTPNSIDPNFTKYKEISDLPAYVVELIA